MNAYWLGSRLSQDTTCLVQPYRPPNMTHLLRTDGNAEEVGSSGRLLPAHYPVWK